ncbi:MAG: MBOAT family O-acyltransferase [Bacteroidales bacterium]|nr:MBOAT family O-acyltransferase [Bacteroidales bacterium]
MLTSTILTTSWSNTLNSLTTFFGSVFAFNEQSPLLFTQFYFWAFFAIVFALFSLMKSKRLLRNAFLCFVSWFFYYKTSGLSLLILVFVTCSDFLIAKRIYHSPSETHKKLWVALSLMLDLGLLCYFKYAYFFTDLINTLFNLDCRVFNLFAWVGNGFSTSGSFNVDRIVLPVGISFYTFQVISYIMDVYRGDVKKPVDNILDFGFYVSFFPQLVAGPIVRASKFIPQLYKPFFLSRRQMGIAVFWILNGLVKKIVLSDYLAVNFVDRVFDNPLLFTGFENLMALFLYSLQVYADFSGYTDIAIGVAMLMGFYLPQNFNSPYKAPNAGNFWKRWHISLSQWLQNYLYIPLGGNRNASIGTYLLVVMFALLSILFTGSWIVAAVIFAIAIPVMIIAIRNPEKKKKITTNINLMLTMLIGGFWHGASWNFMIWGGLNGIGIVTYKFWRGWSPARRLLMISLAFVAMGTLSFTTHLPVFNLFAVWSGSIWIGTLIRYIYSLTKSEKPFKRLANVWAIAQTFTFITFTRLFFRSGSNLDPATANQEAWNTAKNMVTQIGSKMQASLIPDIIAEYHKVFIVFILGMVIHWLPDRWKRMYRITFAQLPLPIMALCVVAVVFFVYQFITADLQAFIYFQF